MQLYVVNGEETLSVHSTIIHRARVGVSFHADIACQPPATDTVLCWSVVLWKGQIGSGSKVLS